MVWWLGKRQRTGAQGSDAVVSGRRSAKAADAKTVEELRAAVAALQQQLLAQGALPGEWLYHWQSPLPYSGSEPEWAQRYFVLQGNTLRYYKTVQDTAFSPREEYCLQGCTVEWQGLLNDELWGWAIVDASGSLLLKVAAADEQTANNWVEALTHAGCVYRNAAIAPHSLQRAASLGLPAAARSRASYELQHRAFSCQAPSVQANRLSLDLSRSTAQLTPPVTAAPLVTVSSQGKHQAHPQSPVGTTASAADAPAAGPRMPGSVPGAQQDPASTQQAPPAPASPEHLPPPPEAHAEPAAESQPPQGTTVKRHQPMTASSPVHTSARPSYLSSERMWSERHTGLLNLMVVILVASHFRLALENALKYGLRLNLLRAIRDVTVTNPNIYIAMCYPVLALLSSFSLMSELLGSNLLHSQQQYEAGLLKKSDGSTSASKVISQQVRARVLLHEWLLFLVNLANTSAVMLVPCAVITATSADPLSGGVLICITVVIWMKLVSYHHANADLRAARRAGEVRPGELGSPSSQEWAILAYPDNLTASNLAYFLAAPTLCYQPNFPRSGPIRWKWLARRVGELVVMLTVLSLLLAQYLEPAVANSMKPLNQMDWPHLLERLLKLALPNTYCWLVMFYCLFHLWLNILAELLRFADREFYRDWWNAPTLGDYWKLWNQPVHKWLLRHVYFPALRLGLGRYPAMLVVFFVSAVFHELVLGVPLHMVRLWAFTGIMLQVPMIQLTEYVRKKLNRDEAGNIVFWLTFCVVGQPMTILLYAHDYWKQCHA